MVYDTKFARALDDSPKVRSYLLYLIIALSCGVLFALIFPIVATEEELGDGNPKDMYSMFSRMFWVEFGDVLDFGNNIVVTVHIYVSLVGFTTLVKTDTPFFKQDEYQFAKWSDCHPDNHTEILTPGRRLLNMDMDTGLGSQEYSNYDVHRMLATATIGDDICTSVSEDCLHSSTSTEGLIVFCLLLSLAGIVLGALRVYQIENKNWHQISIITWFLCSLVAIVSLAGYQRDCIQSIVTVIQENRDKYSQATSSPTDSVGNIAKALIAVICLAVILCVGNLSVFPARKNSSQSMSQAERARSNSAARAASTISPSNPMQQQVAPRAPPSRTAGGAINDPNNEL